MITRGYRWLKGVTGNDKGLPGLKEGYKGLQGVTKGYMGFQGVTRGYSLTHILARDPNPTSRNTLSTISSYFEIVGLH